MLGCHRYATNDIGSKKGKGKAAQRGTASGDGNGNEGCSTTATTTDDDKVYWRSRVLIDATFLVGLPSFGLPALQSLGDAYPYSMCDAKVHRLSPKMIQSYIL